MQNHRRLPHCGGGPAVQRLKALCKTTDGFRIAEEDLRLRGPGDFFGSRQSGLPAFRVGDLSFDLETLKQAQAASAQWIDTLGTSQTPEAQALRQRIGELFRRAEGTMNFDLETLKQAQAASAQWIDTLGTSQTPEAQALRQRIGELFRRAEGTMN